MTSAEQAKLSRGSGIKATIRRIVHGIETLVEWVGSYMVGIMVAIVIYQVFGRYVLHQTPAWTEEIVLLFMTAYGFLSIACGFGRQSHLSVSMLYDRFPKWLRSVMDRASDLLIVAFGVFLFVEGYKFVGLTWSSTLPVTELPNGIQYLVVPVTGLIIVIHGLFWLFIGEEEKQ